LIGNSIDMTSQNHGFSTDETSLRGKAQVTHRNLYDGTVEGIGGAGGAHVRVHTTRRTARGPHDSRYLFRRFLQLIEGSG